MLNYLTKEKSDVFVSFPSGFGRSLCYQFPAAVNSNKVTIVFCSQLDRIKVRCFVKKTYFLTWSYIRFFSYSIAITVYLQLI